MRLCNFKVADTVGASVHVGDVIASHRRRSLGLERSSSFVDTHPPCSVPGPPRAMAAALVDAL